MWSPTPPAFVIGGGVMPAPLLAAVLDRATIREIRHPGDAAPEPGYRPSTSLAEFVRCRDLTCRWPGCDHPADRCDLDHTMPYPAGPTHASNLKCYCRFQDWVNTLNYDCKSYYDLPAGQSVQLSHRGLSYSPEAGLIRRSQRFTTHNRGVS